MELLWAALPMVGCAVMMALMMRMMAGGHRTEAPAEPDTAERRANLEAEVDDLKSRLGEAKNS